MIILQTVGISKSFGIDKILSDINIQVQSNDRIGLVGVNGAGKSTLLKIIASEMLPDSGDIQIGKEIKIGYLAQDSGLESENNIWDEMISVFSGLIEKEKYIRNLEKQMADPKILNNEDKYKQVLKQYSLATDKFRENGGYSYESKIRGVLHGLNFQKYDYHSQSIHTLSGGQKTRLALAKLLLEEPNILMLDEPTNYLDMETLTWLENYLKSYIGAILVVSHDRYFLDSLVTTIYEIDKTKTVRYKGNYSQYIDQKSEQSKLQQKKFEKQQAEISKLEDFVQKNIARASTTRRAQSRRKQLEKIDKVDKPSSNRSAFFTFETDTESGNNVLMIKDLKMGFGSQVLFKNVSFHIDKEERVALVGPNGIGKSTLFKLILNNGLDPLDGTVDIGSNVKIGYYSQEQEELNLGNSVINELWDEYPTIPEAEIRKILGNFLFIGDDVFKKIKDLSGGEKARISLAKLMLKKANFLLLDEPTNHLDIFSREVLENALVDYTGTIFFISHDRYFLNRIATQTLELTPSGVNNYLGNYSYYIEKKMELEEDNQDQINTSDEKSNKESYIEERQKLKIERQLLRRIEALESEIEQLEQKIENIEAELLLPEVYSNHVLANQKNDELIILKSELDKFLEEWEQAQQELDN